MSDAFWQAKIWGILHDPALKALHNNHGRGGSSFWQSLAAMQDWTERNWEPEKSGKKFFEHIHLADYITSASDRGAIGAASNAVNYAENGLEISHLLSGEKLRLKLSPEIHHKLLQPKRTEFLQILEETLLPEAIKQEKDPKKVFWWLWRCFPTAVCKAFDGDESLLLMPAETRLPDSSIWNHTSLTSAMAGALAGYDLTTEDIEDWRSDKTSHPYLAVFSFTPIQELIQASRKMRDFWAGSWILHYLSAKVSWALAWKYGPDSLIYPSLFAQPLIDYWLLNGTGRFDGWRADFSEWVKPPSERKLLTAGFPNILVIVLPKDKVRAAMQMAEETLRREWLNLAHLSFEELANRYWMKGLAEDAKTWNGWLDGQWQSYWSAVAIGKEGESLKSAAISSDREDELNHWLDVQNNAYGIYTTDAKKLFQPNELEYLRAALQYRLEKQGRRFSVNVGSWWPFIFDKTRAALAGSKNVRTWELPTAFGVRSTVSGLGPAVHPGSDWMPEGDVKKCWKNHAGLFDGREQLNATETVKRTLHQILPKVIGGSDEEKIQATYPDLTAGVAGYLKVSKKNDLEHFQNTCRAIQHELHALNLDNDVVVKDLTAWGIPWADETFDSKKVHSRLLSPDWLLEDSDEAAKQADPKSKLQSIVDRAYPNNNPADWYVLAAGDGDGMNEWLKGQKLYKYQDYIASGLKSSDPNVQASFEKFLSEDKRMGPSTHSGLSRALLDFSNQLVPYLTENRYAGRLIYSGGDDVLAYTSLWEWDKWLWDIRQCFRGEKDERLEFDNTGHYWKWLSKEAPTDAEGNSLIDTRPLFTMGGRATISFGIVIAHHSVPLAIALEQLRKAETDGAKKHTSPDGNQKDAVQVCVLYGNGNTLKATTKFDVFNIWRKLLAFKEEHPNVDFDPALFEQAAELLRQHPIPTPDAIQSWVQAFCDRRDIFKDTEDGRQAKADFKAELSAFIRALWETTLEKSLDREFQSWLKLAAFILRKREIKLGGVS